MWKRIKSIFSRPSRTSTRKNILNYTPETLFIEPFTQIPASRPKRQTKKQYIANVSKKLKKYFDESDLNIRVDQSKNKIIYIGDTPEVPYSKCCV